MDFSLKDLTTKQVLLYICTLLVAMLLLKILMQLLPIALIFFALIAPAIYVLADAQERKIKRPILWAVFTMCTWVFGLLVYLLARPEGAGKKFCRHCGGEVDPSFHNCPWCNKSLQVTKTCRNCSFEIKTGWKFCPQCQVEVTPTPASPSKPPPPPQVAENPSSDTPLSTA